jgi:WD40 repeat protein
MAIVFDAKSGKDVCELRGHSAGVLSAVFSPEGTRVVTASRIAKIWNVE